ncbi:MAG: hypothetical protein AAGA35_01080 [Patescibacteria group bacterium]
MIQLATIYFLIAGSILAVVHIIALELFLYWHFLWLDIPVHLLGGCVAGLGLYVLRDLRIIPALYCFKLWQILGFVIIVAGLWELFELFIVGREIEENFIQDTIIDLIMGFLGGWIAYYVGESSKLGSV